MKERMEMVLYFMLFVLLGLLVLRELRSDMVDHLSYNNPVRSVTNESYLKEAAAKEAQLQKQQAQTEIESSTEQYYEP